LVNRFLPLLLAGKNRAHVEDVVSEGRLLPQPREFLQIAGTFLTVLVGWAFFRAPDVNTAFWWICKLFGMGGLLSASTLSKTDTIILEANQGVKPIAQTGVGVGDLWMEKVFTILLPIVLLVIIEWFNRNRSVPKLPSQRWIRWTIYLLLILVLATACGTHTEFIYFQF